MFEKIRVLLLNLLQKDIVEKLPKHYDSISYLITKEMIDHNGHANFRFLCELFEKGFHEYLKKRHTSYDFLQKEFGKTIFFRHQEISYLGELKLGDIGDIYTGISEMHTTSFVVHQIIENKNGKPLVFHKVIIVMVNKGDKKKSVIPDRLRERILS